MNRESASKVHAFLLQAAKAIDDSVAVLKVESEEEFAEHRRGAGRVLSALFDELLLPLYREHPELIPPELDRTYLKL